MHYLILLFTLVENCDAIVVSVNMVKRLEIILLAMDVIMVKILRRGEIDSSLLFVRYPKSKYDLESKMAWRNAFTH